MEPSVIGNILQLSELPLYFEKVDRRIQCMLDSAEPSLRNAVARTLQSGGKRLRAALVLAAAGHEVAFDTPEIISAGAAIELLHLGSLMHDDIIDNSSLRRGVPTVVAKEGMQYALLAGDYALAMACKEASGIHAQLGEITAGTIATLCAGESRELGDLYNKHRSKAALEATIRTKTAILFSNACRMGALIAGHDQVSTDHLAMFGHYFGMAFQYIDDLLDFVAMPERYGKPIGTDVHEGVYTLPVIIALQGMYTADVRRLLDKKAAMPLAELTELLDKSGGFTLCAQAARAQAAEARKQLIKCHVPKLSALAGFPDTYVDWALDTLVAPKYQASLKH